MPRRLNNSYGHAGARVSAGAPAERPQVLLSGAAAHAAPPPANPLNIETPGQELRTAGKVKTAGMSGE